MIDVFDEDEPQRPPKKKKHKFRPLDLPPGDARREAMKQATDDLAEEAEARSEDVGAIDPAKLELIPEIVSRAAALEVSNQQSDYVYCWARFKAESGISQVEAKLAMSIKARSPDGRLWNVPVWEVVTGDMPEARELKSVDGTRRLGDVLLLRAKKPVHEAVERAAEERNRLLQEGPRQAAQEFTDKTGIRTYTEADLSNPLVERAMKHSEAKYIANKRMDDMIRRGMVPGMEIRR